MGPQAFLNTLSIVLAFIASLFFCFGSAEMKAKNIKTLAGTYWDSNPHLRAFLISLKADYLSGALALCFAFFLQFFANVPGTVPSEPVFISSAAGALLAVVIGAIIGGLFYGYRRYVIRSLEQQFSPEEEGQ